MNKAAHPLNTPSALSGLEPNEGSDASVSLSGGTRSVAFLSSRMPPRRSSALSMAAPAPPAGHCNDTLEDLRRRILAIERPRLEARHGIDETHEGVQAGPRTAAWSLGAPEVDALLGANALDTGACHEIKPASSKAASRAAALAFALALARRRLGSAIRSGKELPRILWCSSPRTILDAGGLYPPGLVRFGLDASSLLMVDARRDDEVLWVLEEGLRSGSLVLAIGALSSIDLTPARRLSSCGAGRGDTTPHAHIGAIGRECGDRYALADQSGRERRTSLRHACTRRGAACGAARTLPLGSARHRSRSDFGMVP